MTRYDIAMVKKQIPKMCVEHMTQVCLCIAEWIKIDTLYSRYTTRFVPFW